MGKKIISFHVKHDKLTVLVFRKHEFFSLGQFYSASVLITTSTACIPCIIPKRTRLYLWLSFVKRGYTRVIYIYIIKWPLSRRVTTTIT